jgi:NADP-reducing hydrogenase subunit HndC
MGTSVRDIVFEIGGGIPGDKKIRAVQLGGPSGGCIPESTLDTPIDYEEITKLGAIMGSGGLIVMDEESCMVDAARFFMEFCQEESCGKCTPCREGTKRMLEILTRICNGKGKDGDIELLEEMTPYVKDSSLCGLGQTAPNPVLTTIRYFREEYESHIFKEKCPAGVCKSLVTYCIDSELCKGCGLCAKKCPQQCISGEKKQPHVIDKEQCVRCGVCMDVCKFDAVTHV